MGLLCVLLIPIIFFCSKNSYAGGVQYGDPNAKDSPGYGRTSTGPKVGDHVAPSGDAKAYDDNVKNSGLYKKDSPSYKGDNETSNSGSAPAQPTNDAGKVNPNGETSGAVSAADGAESKTYSSNGKLYDLEKGEYLGEDPNYKGGGTKSAPQSAEAPSSEASNMEASPAQPRPLDGGEAVAGGDAVTPPVDSNAPPISEADAKKAEAKAVRNDGPYNKIISSSTAINQLASSRAEGAILTVPGLPALLKAKAEYTTSRESCLKAQAQASFICQEESSPQLQSTLQNVNMVVAAVNTIAIKDACGTMAKAMRVAQIGITGYTVACGALKFRCDMACGDSKKALGEIEASLVKPASCASTTPDGAITCKTLISKYTTLVTNVHQGVSAELQEATVGTIGKNVKICGQEYGKLLLSAGLGIVSTVNSFAQANKCSKNTDGNQGSAQSSTASSSSSTSAAVQNSTTGGLPATAAGNGATSSLELASSSPLINPTVTGGSIATPETKKVGVVVPVVQKSKEELEKENPYRAYLPGGSKAAASEDSKMSGLAQWRKEVTGANGPTNFNKMQDSYRSQKNSLLDY